MLKPVWNHILYRPVHLPDIEALKCNIRRNCRLHIDWKLEILMFWQRGSVLLRVAAGCSNDRLLCHVQRPEVSKRSVLQQLFPVCAVTRGDQCNDSQVVVGTQWADDCTR